MKTFQYGRPAPASNLPRILLMVGMLAVGGVGSLILLAAAGVVDLPFLHAKSPEPPKSPPPQGVAIPLSARPIAAYTKVTRDDIWNTTANEPLLTYYPADLVKQKGWLTVEQVLDHRVLRKDIPIGCAFDESCFYPPGTTPGMAAGVPNGKISYVLEARQVDGVNDLKIGDRIDVLGAVMIEFDKVTRTYHTIPTAPNRAGQKLEYKEGQTAIVEALAQDAVVVEPLTTRQVPDENAPIPVQTGMPKMRVARDVTIAIDPAEAGRLTEAVAVGGEIFVVAHTGLPDALRTQTPGYIPLTPIQTVETVVGDKHDVKLFPDRSGKLPFLGPTPAYPGPTPPAAPTGPTKTADDKESSATTAAAKGAQP